MRRKGWPARPQSAFLCVLARIYGSQQIYAGVDVLTGLLGVWVGIKFLTFGRVASGGLRLMSPNSPFSNEKMATVAA